MDDSTLTHETNQVVKRQSGVELLKVIGIFLVILCHVVQTLIDWDQPWSIPINGGVTDVTHFTIAFLRYTGMFGNILFFTCSAWFLLDKKQTNYKKVMRMILDIFVISVLWLIPILIWKKGTLDKRDILYSLLPTYFSNNWYMTSYILFCFVYPVLNLSIKHLDQRKHLIVAAVLFIAYFILNFIYLFPWASTCALWVTIYYVMSYFKLYGQRVCQSKSINILLMLVAIILHFGLLFLSNFIYLKTG